MKSRLVEAGGRSPVAGEFQVIWLVVFGVIVELSVTHYSLFYQSIKVGPRSKSRCFVDINSCIRSCGVIAVKSVSHENAPVNSIEF